MEVICYSEEIAATYWSKQEFVTQKTTVVRSPNVFQILYKTIFKEKCISRTNEFTPY